jgi:hypothetical protein
MTRTTLFCLQVARNVCSAHLGFNQVSTMAYYNVYALCA